MSPVFALRKIKATVIAGCLFLALPVAAQVSEGLYIKEYPWRMHSLYYPKTPGCDSVYAAPYGEVWYYNSDSLFRKMADGGRTHEVEDLLQHFYYQVMDYMPVEQQLREQEKMSDAARRYRSSFLQDEAGFMEILIDVYFRDSAGTAFDDNAGRMNRLIERAAERGDRNTECILLFELFQMYRVHGNYAKAFGLAPVILQKAEALTVETCPMLRIIYSFIGDAYYLFRDYERAFACLRKVEALEGILFADRHSLLVKETFALHYAALNRLDSSDYYFRALYDSEEKVRFRASYDVAAAAGIAANMVRRGDCDRAIPLLRRWYPEAVKESYKYAAEISISLARCFLAKKQFPRAKAFIDSAQAAVAVRPENLPLLEKFYNVRSDYCEALGDAACAIRYSDSARLVAGRQAEKTNALIILRAEQELFEAEKALKNEQITRQQSRIFFICIISLLSLSALSVLIFLYYKKRAAYRRLVAQSREWAGITAAAPGETATPAAGTPAIAEPDIYDLSLMNEIEQLIKEKKRYKDSSLSLEILAKELKVKRNYISSAINRCRQVNFNTYINEYRIKEAVQIISGSRHEKISIKELSFDVGFNDRSVFSRTFKKITGLSPNTFIQNR